ncbi:O-antigen ligase [Pseudomonas sp. D(2018)]|uniref:O-antigen ligase family protein n=1 Tax=Pseudomonas sp. D(2018) TaxID=2502238 RepID=UPI002114417F|nr:O-antigen ligase family protein [Pseudomonas sp. D(2018)]
MAEFFVMDRERLGSWLSRLAVLGVVCFLCAPWVLPSNTYYHRLVILFLWIPAFWHFCLFHRGYPKIHKVFAGLYLAISIWYVFVVVMSSDGWDDVRDLKLPFYIALSLLGVMVAAMHLKERFRDLLLLCCVFGGLAAGFTCFYTYFVQGHIFYYRVVSFGVWRVVIPAAQACGALAILTAMLGLEAKRSVWVISLVLLALLGYAAFLYFNQSRWIWVCLMLSFVLVGLLLRSKTAYVMAAISVLLIAVVLVLKPALILNRGFSYRPELWMGGLSLLLDNWVHGLGFQEYWIQIAALKTSARHPHNLFLDIGIRFGVLGLLLWVGIWCWTGWIALIHRNTTLGRAAIALWLYSGLVVLTEGTVPWVKPSPIWFVTWLPIALVLVIDALARQARRDRVPSVQMSGGA